jgi:hypothetical protein
MRASGAIESPWRIRYGAPVPWRALSVLVCISAGLVRGASAQSFTGFGPVPARNYQPIQLIFLNLPVERARTVAAGLVAVHAETAEINTIATASNASYDARLKFETNRTVFGAKLGLLPGLEAGLDIPFLSHFGGFLDPPIDSIEAFFGTSNPERDDYPNNSFGDFFVRKGTTSVFQGYHQVFELGDLWFSAKQEVWSVPDWPLVSVRAAVKAPTGRAGGVFGSGKPDFGLGLATEYQVLHWLVFYGNFAGIFPVGPIADADLTLNPFINQAVALEAGIFSNCSLLVQQGLYTSPFHGTGIRLLDGTPVDITVALNVVVGDLLLQLAATDNVSPVEPAADFTLLFRVASAL